jgi:hypothetical protein
LAGGVCPNLGWNSSLTACLVNPSTLQSLQGQVSESKPPKHPGPPVNPPVGPKPTVGWNS